MKEQIITITFHKKQIISDVLVQCNLMGRALQKTPGSEELASEVMTPDSADSKPVVARALVEAWNEVKKICQRYLTDGRSADDNRLERISWKDVEGKEDFGSFVLNLNMPAHFNAGMTESVKSDAHRMIVDYTIRAFLLDKWPEKSAEYERRFVVDAESLRSDLRSRFPFVRCAEDWA